MMSKTDPRGRALGRRDDVAAGSVRVTRRARSATAALNAGLGRSRSGADLSPQHHPRTRSVANHDSCGRPSAVRGARIA